MSYNPLIGLTFLPHPVAQANRDQRASGYAASVAAREVRTQQVRSLTQRRDLRIEGRGERWCVPLRCMGVCIAAQLGGRVDPVQLGRLDQPGAVFVLGA